MPYKQSIKFLFKFLFHLSLGDVLTKLIPDNTNCNSINAISHLPGNVSVDWPTRKLKNTEIKMFQSSLKCQLVKLGRHAIHL